MSQDNVRSRNGFGLFGSVMPAAVGAASGLALLAALSVGQSAPETETASVRIEAGTVRPAVPEISISLPAAPVSGRERASATVGGILLPPDPAAAEVTRRLENGLPLRDPPPAAQPPAEPEDTRPMIAVVMDDMGFDRVSSALAVSLPAAVTLSYLPDAPDVARQVRAARRQGHTVMLHLPMEAPGHRGRPGQNVLAVADSEEVLRKRLSRMLGSFDGYVGVNNHMGSRFTRDSGRMRVVLSELRRRGLFFLDSRTSNKSVGGRVADAANVPYAVRDVFLDHDADPDKIRRRFAETERIARKTGQAIAIAHPRPTTMKLLAPWVRSLADRGFRLVPITKLLKRPSSNKLAQLHSAE